LLIVGRSLSLAAQRSQLRFEDVASGEDHWLPHERVTRLCQAGSDRPADIARSHDADAHEPVAPLRAMQMHTPRQVFILP